MSQCLNDQSWRYSMASEYTDYRKEYRLEERVLGPIIKRMTKMKKKEIFLEFKNETVTYEEMNQLVNKVANGLLQLGVKKGEKVGIMLPNCPEFVYSWFGSNKIGAVYVPINTAYKGDMLQYVINQADVKVLVVDRQFLERVQFIEKNLVYLEKIIVRHKGGQEERIYGPLSSRFEIVPFEEVYDSPVTDPNIDVNYTDDMGICFTSGTTGPSKGVLSTHAHIITFALNWCWAVRYAPADTIYSCLPLFHAIAAWIGVLAALVTGTKVSLEERFSASRYWDDIRKYRPTIAHAIFSMIPILLKQPKTAEDAENTVRLIHIAQQNDEFEGRFNLRLFEAYGSTETGALTFTFADEPRKRGSCGKAYDEFYEVKIFDDRDNELSRGEIGEIVVRPKQPYSLFKEYYKMPRETLDAFGNLWFHTGDHAYTDEEGYFYFVDRKKDAIRRKGENISSFEVERAVNSHPSVLESAAIAVPSELGKETKEDEVKIVVVIRAGQELSYQQLINFCYERLPYFMVPRYVEFKDSLPKSASEKIQKYKLREEGIDGITQNTWDLEKAGMKIIK